MGRRDVGGGGRGGGVIICIGQQAATIASPRVKEEVSVSRGRGGGRGWPVGGRCLCTRERGGDRAGVALEGGRKKLGSAEESIG